MTETDAEFVERMENDRALVDITLPDSHLEGFCDGDFDRLIALARLGSVTVTVAGKDEVERARAALGASPDRFRAGMLRARTIADNLARMENDKARSLIGRHAAMTEVRNAIDAEISVSTAEHGADDGWPSQAATDVMAERRRQVEVEGWTPEHDDIHNTGELADAAACYASTFADLVDRRSKGGLAPRRWPWACEWWKPTDRRRDLVKAGALILAEIERLDRLPSPPSPGARR